MKGFGAERNTTLDLTRTAQEDEIVLPADLLAVIAVPVYGGKVAPTAFVRLQRIRAQGTPAVLVVVYGNRDYEGALQELDGLARLLGFVPVAAGRPDSHDLEQATQFGQAVREKLAGVASLSDLPPPAGYPYSTSATTVPGPISVYSGGGSSASQRETDAPSACGRSGTVYALWGVCPVVSCGGHRPWG